MGVFMRVLAWLSTAGVGWMSSDIYNTENQANATGTQVNTPWWKYLLYGAIIIGVVAYGVHIYVKWKKESKKGGKNGTY